MKYLPVILSFCLLVLNLLTFIGNVIFAIINRKNQRNYDSQFELYSKLILEKINDYISYSVKLEVELYRIIDICKNPGIIDKRNKIENSCDKLENIYKKMERETIVLAHCYSEPLLKQITNSCENIYDNTTELVSNLDSNVITVQFENILKEKFKYYKANYLKSIYYLIKKFKPKS